MFKRMVTGQLLTLTATLPLRTPTLPHVESANLPTTNPSQPPDSWGVSLDDMTMEPTNALKRKGKKVWHKFFNKGRTNDPEKNKTR